MRASCSPAADARWHFVARLALTFEHRTSAALERLRRHIRRFSHTTMLVHGEEHWVRRGIERQAIHRDSLAEP